MQIVDDVHIHIHRHGCMDAYIHIVGSYPKIHMLHERVFMSVLHGLSRQKVRLLTLLAL
jgi:hypothetical protein